MSLRMAATTLLHGKSYLGGWYRHLRRQLPSYAAAIKAMARCLAVLVYRADESFWRGLNGQPVSEHRSQRRAELFHQRRSRFREPFQVLQHSSIVGNPQAVFG